MDSARKVSQTKRRRAPATSPEAREKQLTALAYDAVEKRIREGKASSQELVHFLRVGSTKEQLEKENIELKNQLTEARTESLQSAARMEELYQEAIRAFGTYRGSSDEDGELYD